MRPIKYNIDGTVTNFRLFGFATGSYLCQCSICKKQFMGDKRSYQCLECAIEYAVSGTAKNVATFKENEAKKLSAIQKKWIGEI
jgi:hypothetical protein